MQTSQEQRTVQQAANFTQAHILIICTSTKVHLRFPLSTCDTPKSTTSPRGTLHIPSYHCAGLCGMLACSGTAAYLVPRTRYQVHRKKKLVSSVVYSVKIDEKGLGALALRVSPGLAASSHVVRTQRHHHQAAKERHRRRYLEPSHPAAFPSRAALPCRKSTTSTSTQGL